MKIKTLIDVLARMMLEKGFKTLEETREWQETVTTADVVRYMIRHPELKEEGDD